MSQAQYNAINQTKLINLRALQALPVPQLMLWLSSKPQWMQRAMIKALSH